MLDKTIPIKSVTYNGEKMKLAGVGEMISVRTSAVKLNPETRTVIVALDTNRMNVTTEAVKK